MPNSSIEQVIAPFLDRCRFRPYAHQVVGISKLIEHPFFGLFDEMGAGKTIQTIVAAMILFELGVIDKVLIFAPASVRAVWFDPELGELRKHLWPDLNFIVYEFHAKTRQWASSAYNPNQRHLQIAVTNYELVGRSKNRVLQLLQFCTHKTLLVLDESSAIKNYRANQTKACVQIRNHCGRIVLLNGTPIANSPLDMFSQGNMLHPSILQCKYITHYRAKYAVMANHHNFPQIIGWQNLEDLQRRFAPYVIRRLKKDCLDLPEKLPAVTLTCVLSEQTWSYYKDMRDQLVVWVSNSSVSIAGQAITKVLRLAQITSGFLGGIEREIQDEDLDNEVDPDRPSFIAGGTIRVSPQPLEPYTGPVKELGREKLDLLIEWWKERLVGDPNLKLLIFSRFRPELTRMMGTFETVPGLETGSIMGGQKKPDRDKALRLLDPRTAPPGPAVVGGTYGTGSKGHTFTACHTIVNSSYDYSLEKFLQSGDRIHRPGQVEACSFFDIVAVGPKGQKTIDHDIVRARRGKEDVSVRTQSAWVDVLQEE